MGARVGGRMNYLKLQEDIAEFSTEEDEALDHRVTLILAEMGVDIEEDKEETETEEE